MEFKFPPGASVSEVWWSSLPKPSRKFWRRVFSVYTSYGLRVIADPTRKFNTWGHVYSNGEVSLFEDVVHNDPVLSLHDLAHWRLAPPERRDLPNWGLGEYPGYPDSADQVVPNHLALEEERLATALGALMAGELYGARSLRYVQSVFGATGEDDLTSLVSRGLIVKRPRSYQVVW